jgi:hypothetical protein
LEASRRFGEDRKKLCSGACWSKVPILVKAWKVRFPTTFTWSTLHIMFVVPWKVLLPSIQVER